MRIAIFGLGYVGLTAAACLCKQGHKVIGVDVSAEKVRQVQEGRCPITEPGLPELLETAHAGNLLTATQEPAAAVEQADLAIVCVGTPSAADGSHNMGFIADVSRQIATALKSTEGKKLTVAYRSTVRPGTMEELITPIFESILGRAWSKVELVYNPEFLRESVAIADYFNPPKIVIGTRGARPSAAMDEIHRGINAPVFYTEFREAEFTKFVDNTWHAVKVAYANEIGRICLALNISASKVHEIFTSDTKLNISSYYLRPGGAFGGSCLPKDVRALQYIGADVGAQTALIDSLLRSNDAHKHQLFTHVTRGVPENARVLLLGLAFKNNSDDLRESPNVDMARKLMAAGFRLSVFEPSISPDKLMGQNLGYTYSHLPIIDQLLVSRDEAEESDWDLVVDANGTASSLRLKAAKIVNINQI